MSEPVTFECGECGAKQLYRLDFDSDMPEGWYRLEDRIGYLVLCSVRCLRALVTRLEAVPTPEPERR